MYDVLKGIRVLEVAAWTFTPAAGAILADWGADVIKVEHPETGDPQRGLLNDVIAAGGVNPIMELPNRGKRSLGIDIGHPEARPVFEALVRRSDVFITSFMPRVLRKLEIELEHIRAINPDIIYVRGTGMGSKGPEAERPAYDGAATWARSGIAHLMTLPGQDPPTIPGSIGDLTGGMIIAGAIAAALLHRERTGEAVVVESSLLATGMWLMSQSITGAPYGRTMPFNDRTHPANALVTPYRTSDGRWIWLNMLQWRWWPDLCRHVEREDLIDDPRFATNQARQQNMQDCIAELDKAFAAKTFEEWKAILMTAEGVWAPVQSALEVGVDPQVIANGYFPDAVREDGSTFKIVASPAQFGGQPIGELKAAPEHGQHTDEILLEMDLDWDEIIRLKERAAVL
jgi:crotonobetainyl-CoA:carnitine CoA-transferase CaiB-like acyl-CoA transferase